MPLIYGEGMASASKRLQEDIDKRNREGYDYILPWDFLDITKYRESTVCDIILEDLKAI
jgi:hypothetical protein